MTDYKLEQPRDKAFFRDIAFGEMFLDEMDKPCVKIFDTTLKKGEEVNAVRITDGLLCYFTDNWSVVPIKKVVFTV